MNKIITTADKAPLEEDKNLRDVSHFANQAGLALGGKIGGRVINLIGEIAIARVLGTALFGVYAIGITILRVVGTVAPLGLHNGVIWFGTPWWKKDNARIKGVIIHSLLVGGLSGLLISGLLFIFAPQLATFYAEPKLIEVIRWFTPAYFFLTLLRIASSASRITIKAKYSLLAEDISQPLIFVVLLVIFVILFDDLIGSLAATTISFGVSLLIALFYLYKLFFIGKPGRIDYSDKIPLMLQYSLPTAFTGFLGTANLWVDRFLVKYFRPSADVGIYQAASQSSMMFVIILSAVNSIFGPMIADYYHKKAIDDLEKLFRVSTKWGLYIGLPFFLTILITPDLVITTVFGEAYAAGAVPMVILNIGQLVNLMTGSVGFILIMTANQYIWLVIMLVSLILSVLLSIILTPAYGLLGASIASSIATSFQFLGALYFVYRKLHIWPYDRRYIKGIFAGIATFVYILIASRFDSVNPFIHLIILTGGSYAAFGLILLIFGLDQEDKHIIGLIKNRLQNLSKPVK
jgi:O-antigen/teichoic acid export membrane protein